MQTPEGHTTRPAANTGCPGEEGGGGVQKDSLPFQSSWDHYFFSLNTGRAALWSKSGKADQGSGADRPAEGGAPRSPAGPALVGFTQQRFHSKRLRGRNLPSAQPRNQPQGPK